MQHTWSILIWCTNTLQISCLKLHKIHRIIYSRKWHNGPKILSDVLESFEWKSIRHLDSNIREGKRHQDHQITKMPVTVFVNCFRIATATSKPQIFVPQSWGQRLETKQVFQLTCGARGETPNSCEYCEYALDIYIIYTHKATQIWTDHFDSWCFQSCHWRQGSCDTCDDELHLTALPPLLCEFK